MNRRQLIGVGVAAVLAGCSSTLSPKERATRSRAELAKRQPALQAKISAIQALASVPLPRPEERLTSPGVRLTSAGDPPTRNLIVVPLEQLPSLAASPAGGPFLDHEMQLAPKWIAGVENVESIHPDMVSSVCAEFEGLQYVAILKTNRYVKPAVSGDSTFTPGTYAGEVHLYGIDGRRWGGVSFAASSSEAVNSRKGHDDSWIMSDMTQRISEAMNAAVRKHVPEATL